MTAIIDRAGPCVHTTKTLVRRSLVFVCDNCGDPFTEKDEGQDYKAMYEAEHTKLLNQEQATRDMERRYTQELNKVYRERNEFKNKLDAIEETIKGKAESR